MVSLTFLVSQWLSSFVAHNKFSALPPPNSKKPAFTEIRLSELSQFQTKQPGSLSRFTPFPLSSEPAEKNNIAFSNVQVKASKSGGNRKTKASGKPVFKKNENVWKDDSAVTTTSNELNRKSGGGHRRGSSSLENARKRKARDREHSSDDDSNPNKGMAWPGNARIVVSPAMPVETKMVLQTQEPSTDPLWKTFASSLCGVWRGVGAAFSPITAAMEPIALGDKNEYLYDSRIYSTVEERQESSGSIIHRKTYWAVGNPYGEEVETKLGLQEELADEVTNVEDGTSEDMEDGNFGNAGVDNTVGHTLLEDGVDIEGLSSEPSLGSSVSTDDQTGGGLSDGEEKWVTADLDDKDLRYKTVMEEDAMELEPGIIFFEDGSYSRGPLDLLTGETVSSDIASPTYKIEQCLVKGGHTRLRLVHTISVEQEGEEIQLLRVAICEEEWMGPCNMKSISDTGGHDLRLLSQRKRLTPQELAGSWNVFEVSATAVLPEESVKGAAVERPPYAYFSGETLKERRLPVLPVHFLDKELLDMQDVTVIWLPGGVTAYVDMEENGMLTIGVGWYDNGVNLVMERAYNATGKLHEVRTKSEVKGGWVGGRM